MMTVHTIDIGDRVFCDLCGKEWTDSIVSGGFLFGSKAVCPACARGMLNTVANCGEMHLIRGRCPSGTSFADWCRGLRDGDNTIRVLTDQDAAELLRIGLSEIEHESRD